MDKMEQALRGLLDRYVSLVNSGDCGFWNPEDEDEVKAARESLAALSPVGMEEIEKAIRAHIKGYAGVLIVAHERDYDSASVAACDAWVRALMALISRSYGAGQWMPISSAPKDGTKILAYAPGLGMRETFWAFYQEGSQAREWFVAGKGPSGCWNWEEPGNHWVSYWSPSHWMPLPKSPHYAVLGE
jgi:hypothetical protein